MKARYKIALAFGITLLGATQVFATPYGLGTYGSCTYNETCNISMSTTVTVALNATPTPSGVYTIDGDEVTVTTNSTDGYVLSIESNINTAQASSLVGSGALEIPGVSGTPGTPALLSTNTWGFRVDSLASFGAGPTSAITNQPISSLSFASVPSLGSGVTIKNNTTGAPTGETTNVWYGIYVDSDTEAAVYSRVVVYTAVMQ